MSLVAARYAQALSEAVPDDGALAACLGTLRRLVEAIEQTPPLRHALANPVIDSAAKARVILALAERFEADETTRRFLETIAAHDRLSILDEIAASVAERLDERTNTRGAEVVSAAPLDEEIRAELVRTLERRTGGKIRLEERVDPSLLGGLIARVGSLVYDGSLASRLARLRARLRGQGLGLTH